MKLYTATADTLRYGILISMVIIMLGLAVSWFGYGERILWLGVLMLILTPLFGIIVSLVCLISENDRHWTKVTAALLSVIAAGIAVAMFI